METLVDTSIEYFHKQHDTLPIVVFLSGFCVAPHKDGQMDMLGNVCLATGVLKDESVERTTAVNFEAIVEPPDWQTWNLLADTPKLWKDPKFIPDLDKPMRVKKDGQQTKDWSPEVCTDVYIPLVTLGPRWVQGGSGSHSGC